MTNRTAYISVFGGPLDGDHIEVECDMLRPPRSIRIAHGDDDLELPIECTKSGKLIVRWPKGLP